MCNTLYKHILFCFLLISIMPILNGKNASVINKNTMAMCSSAPKIQCPSLVWLKPNESSDPSRTGMATAQPGSADCLDPIITYSDDLEIINGCHRVITRTWRAEAPEDPSLFVTCVQTIKLIDEIAPSITELPQDIIKYTNSGQCQQTIVWQNPVISDNYLIDFITITGERNGDVFPVENGDMFQEGLTVVTYTVYDFCGNISSASFNITIMCASCFIECPENACLPIGSDVSPDSIGYATSYSGNVNCGEAIFDYQDMLLETGCNGVSTSIRLWSAVFETMPNLEFTCAQRIELKDENELQIFNCPEDFNVKNSYTPVYWEDPVAIHGDNSNITYLTSNYNSGDYFPIGITTVIFMASDLCGNETTCSFKVTVLNDDSYDDCPEDITLSCDGNGTNTVDWTPPVYDGDCTECPKGKNISGFMYMGSFNGSNYYCSSYHHTYAQAKAAVAKYGGHIASIGSREENDYLAAHIASRTALIGLTDIQDEGTFVWDSGEPVTFEDWFTAQPNNANNNQDVVELMRSGEWNDINKDESREFIMELPCEFVTQIEGPTPGEELEVGDYYVLYHIEDGCGLDKYCGFNISIQAGINLSCNESMTIEIPFEDAGIAVEWDALEYSSCCTDCTGTNDCVDITLMSGSPSGSVFLRDTKTHIRYRAEDSCGNTSECAFEVTINTKVGSRPEILNEETSGLYKKEVVVSTTPNQYNIDVHNHETFIVDAHYKEVDQVEKKPIAITKASDINRDEVTQSSATLFPNPTHYQTTLQIPNFENLQNISVFNVSGQLILSKQSNFNYSEVIHTNDWQSGLYYVRLDYSNNVAKTMKLIVY